MGIAVVHVLGRRILPIEREQPSYIVTNAGEIARYNPSTHSSQRMAWPALSAVVSIDYRQWQRIIDLISSVTLVAHPEVMVVDAVTAGYMRLKQDILDHVNHQARAIPQKNLDFIIFQKVWLLALIGLCLGFALYMVFIERLGITWSVGPTAERVLLPLSSIMLVFAPTLSLVFPAVVLWRLVFHRAMTRRALGYDVRVAPWWVIWAAALLCSAASILWISGLVVW
jgi:hypothetical protein